MTFPINPEARGSLGWLRQQVGGYLGWGFDHNTYGHEKISKLDSYIQSGLMQFYYPVPVQTPDAKPNKPHRWSFLTPLATIGFIAGQNTYELPETFTGVVDEVTLQISGATTKTIPVVEEIQIRQLLLGSTPAGTPLYAAIRPKVSNGVTQQKHEIVFYPTPDEAGTASFRFSTAAPPLDDAHPYPLGGQQYYEVILQSCMAVAEERTSGGKGVSSEKFSTLLAAAITWDSQTLQTTDSGVWSLDNEITDLKISRAYLKRRIGYSRKCGPNPETWTHKEAQEIQLILQTGLRKFYHPPVLPGEKDRHEWSFLMVRSRISIQDGVYEYDFPDDYAMIDGNVDFVSETSRYEPLRVVDEHRINSLLQRDDSAGRPIMVSFVAKKLSPLGTQWKMLVYPIPDGSYTLDYKYLVNPMAGTDERELPFGGEVHAQTIIEACLAASEELDGQPGVHSKLFMDNMRASVAHDRSIMSSASLGYNGDPSNGIRDLYGNHHGSSDTIVGIYHSNGTEYYTG
jgi:hypothetical protein